jgi:hypothetical protein
MPRHRDASAIPGSGAVVSESPFVSSYSVAQPQDVYGEHAGYYCAEDQPPGGQASDGCDERPQHDRHTQPAEQKRAKEPSRLDAIARIPWRRNSERGDVMHFSCVPRTFSSPPGKCRTRRSEPFPSPRLPIASSAPARCCSSTIWIHLARSSQCCLHGKQRAGRPAVFGGGSCVLA